MKPKTLLLVVAAFLFIGPSVLAFPSIHTNEKIQENWTVWGDGHNYMYTTMVYFY